MPSLNVRRQQQVPREYDASGFVTADVGHALVKGVTDYSSACFVHALAQIDETSWHNDKLRGILNQDYYIVNGVRYAIGLEAERKDPGQCRRSGASRYTKDYYGVLVAIMLFRLIGSGHDDITLYASHAPEYIQYRDDILKAARGTWTVEDHNGLRKRFKIKQVFFFDEPTGGAMNIILNSTGTAFQQPEMQRGRLLAIDIGGFTVNVARIENGRLVDVDGDPHQGVIAAEEELTRYIRRELRKKLKDMDEITPGLVRDALATGYYDAGGYGMQDVQQAATRATNGVISAVLSRFKRYGGIAGSNYVILTGGGSGAFEDRLRAVLEHPYVYLASSSDDVHFANARGGRKMLHFYKNMGGF